MRRPWKHVIWVVAGLLVAGAMSVPLVGADGSAVADAKRKAAEQMYREGKLEEAITLLSEVTATEAASYRDFLALARVHDKMGNGTEAAKAYRRVLELVPATPRDAEERTARLEADRRVKVLDAYTGRVDAAVDEFVKKLEAMHREAQASGNTAAVERIERLVGAVYHAERRNDRGYCEVASWLEWQDSGFQVTAGQTYHVKAVGTWRPAPKLPACSADGTPEMGDYPTGKGGGLLASIDKKSPFGLGKDVTFTAQASGRLFLTVNDGMKEDNSGAIQVFIERQ